MSVSRMNGASASGCGQCQHWHRQAAPETLKSNTVAIPNVTAPIQGECRAMPPQLLAVTMQQGVMVQAMYPLLAAETPACGLHKARAGVMM